MRSGSGYCFVAIWGKLESVVKGGAAKRETECYCMDFSGFENRNQEEEGLIMAAAAP